MYQGKALKDNFNVFVHISSEISDCIDVFFQIVGSEDRRRTLTPLALRERYSALNEPAMGTSLSLSLLYVTRSVYLLENNV